MTIRTKKTTVTFVRSFRLGGLDELLQAGTYTVETDEELLESLSFPAYRRILTEIHLHAQPGSPGVTRILKIDPKDLESALMRDRAPAEPPADTNAEIRSGNANEAVAGGAAK